MVGPTAPKPRPRGEIEELRSGSLRVKVYAGIDPLTKKRHYLTETVPAGPKAAKEAERVRTRLVHQVDEQRQPRTNATINQLMDRYLEVLDVQDTTRGPYVRYIEKYVRPSLGPLKVGRPDLTETIDSFYAQLRTCRDRCGRRTSASRAARPADAEHVCRPLKPSSIRQIHWILNGAFERAERWRWIGRNPMDAVDPPALPKPDPRPPTVAQAVRIFKEAWKDPDWGLLVWLAVTTGVRRGELCALRWERVDLDAGVMVVRKAIAQEGSRTWETDTKTHQQRRISLDPETVTLLRGYRALVDERLDSLDAKLSEDAFLFSRSPDHSTWLKPDSVSQRYDRMCARLGYDMSIKELRHYSATELISAGVDVRTVAGRLGHSGGGTTTLRVYAAWRAETDQRAAGDLAARIGRPDATTDAGGVLRVPQGVVEINAASPHQRIAADLRAAIACGALKPGDAVATLDELAARYEVAIGTAQRAVSLLGSEGLVRIVRGRRTIVA